MKGLVIKLNKINDRGFKINDYIYYERPLKSREKNEYDKIYIIGRIKEIAWGTDIFVDGCLSEYIPKSLKDYTMLLNKKNSYHDKYLFRDDEISHLIFKTNIVKQKKQDNIYDDLENKDLKIGDYIYNKDDFNGGFYIGQIIRIESKDFIVFYGGKCNILPKSRKEYDNITKQIEMNEILTEEISCYKLTFADEIARQKILDKMEVLKVEIDLALGFKYKTAFDKYVEEYKELENKLKDEVLV
jgi:hypothetical protein